METVPNPGLDEATSSVQNTAATRGGTATARGGCNEAALLRTNLDLKDQMLATTLAKEGRLKLDTEELIKQSEAMSKELQTVHGRIAAAKAVRAKHHDQAEAKIKQLSATADANKGVIDENSLLKDGLTESAEQEAARLTIELFLTTQTIKELEQTMASVEADVTDAAKQLEVAQTTLQAQTERDSHEEEQRREAMATLVAEHEEQTAAAEFEFRKQMDQEVDAQRMEFSEQTARLEEQKGTETVALLEAAGVQLGEKTAELTEEVVRLTGEIEAKREEKRADQGAHEAAHSTIEASAEEEASGLALELQGSLEELDIARKEAVEFDTASAASRQKIEDEWQSRLLALELRLEQGPPMASDSVAEEISLVLDEEATALLQSGAETTEEKDAKVDLFQKQHAVERAQAETAAVEDKRAALRLQSGEFKHTMTTMEGDLAGKAHEMEQTKALLAATRIKVEQLKRLGVASGHGEDISRRLEQVQQKHNHELTRVSDAAEAEKQRCLEQQETDFLQQTKLMERKIRISIEEKNVEMKQQEADFLRRIGEIEKLPRGNLDTKLAAMMKEKAQHATRLAAVERRSETDIQEMRDLYSGFLSQPARHEVQTDKQVVRRLGAMSNVVKATLKDMDRGIGGLASRAGVPPEPPREPDYAP